MHQHLRQVRKTHLAYLPNQPSLVQFALEVSSTPLVQPLAPTCEMLATW